MNDSDLESALRAVHGEIPSPTVSPALRAQVLAIPLTRTKPSHLRWPWPSVGRPWLSSGIRLIAALAIVAVGTGTLLFSVGQSPPPAPTPSSSPTPTGTTNGWIAYATEPGGAHAKYGDPSSEIYIAREGGEPRLLIGEDGTTRNLCPGFSSDGEHLAYGEGSGSSSKTLEREHRAIVVVVLGPDGSIADPAIRLPVSGAGLVPCPTWSPDGRKLAYPDGDAIAIIGLDGTSTVIPDWDPGPGSPWEREFAWSPDGSSIAAARPSGTWVLPIDGGEPRQLLPVYSTFVSWSPDGAWIGTEEQVYKVRCTDNSGPRGARCRNRQPLPDHTQVRLLSADGQRETVDLGPGTSEPLWSPAGDRLVYWTQDGLVTGLVTANADGSDAKVLPDRSGGPLMWSPDARSFLRWRPGGAASWDLITMPASGPGGETSVVSDIPTANARSWLGRVDISWQAVHE